MKKKLITIVIGAMLCAGLFAGCGQSDTKQDKAASTESAKQADTKDEGEKGSQEEKELTGTIDDIKDFMFVVTDDKDTPYSFTFDEKPDGLESRRTPPPLPRTVSTYPRRPSWCTTFVKWFSEILCASAISGIVARRSGWIPRYISTRRL